MRNPLLAATAMDHSTFPEAFRKSVHLGRGGGKREQRGRDKEI